MADKQIHELLPIAALNTADQLVVSTANDNLTRRASLGNCPMAPRGLAPGPYPRRETRRVRLCSRFWRHRRRCCRRHECAGSGVGDGRTPNHLAGRHLSDDRDGPCTAGHGLDRRRPQHVSPAHRSSGSRLVVERRGVCRRSRGRHLPRADEQRHRIGAPCPRQQLYRRRSSHSRRRRCRVGHRARLLQRISSCRRADVGRRDRRLQSQRDLAAESNNPPSIMATDVLSQMGSASARTTPKACFSMARPQSIRSSTTC